jgi:hypothetical protein
VGKPLLAGALKPLPAQHDFQPQLASTQAGEIGCAYYEFGPRGPDEFPPLLIDALLVVSTNGGGYFPQSRRHHRKTMGSQGGCSPLPRPAEHNLHRDYFGLAASTLGFSPLFLSTITGIQEMYVARLFVNPTDLYIRDSLADTGDVPSPGFTWLSPDLIVRRRVIGGLGVTVGVAKGLRWAAKDQ